MSRSFLFFFLLLLLSSLSFFLFFYFFYILNSVKVEFDKNLNACNLVQDEIDVRMKHISWSLIHELGRDYYENQFWNNDLTMKVSWLWVWIQYQLKVLEYRCNNVFSRKSRAATIDTHNCCWKWERVMKKLPAATFRVARWLTKIFESANQLRWSGTTMHS